MAAVLMFRDFSFSRHSSEAHATERASMHVSPMSLRHEYITTPPPAPSVGELARIFDQQTLRVEIDPIYEIPAQDDCASPTEGRAPSHSRISTAALRLQRQSNTRRHYNASHLRDMSKLVERMIEEEDQCHVREPESRTPSIASSSSDSDEGIDMEYTPTNPAADEALLYTLKFRRSGERLNPTAAVAKSVRMRKRSKITKRSSK